jgi:hypothetical protein
MDPYLEDPIEWPDLHFRIIGAISRQLIAEVSPHFYVRVERRISLVEPDAEERRVIIPDVYLAHTATAPASDAPGAENIAAPTVITVLEELEIREHYIEIYDARNRSMVTTIEVLSPSNKVGGAKRAAFLEKRRAVLASPAHWIEIDLLREGERLREVAGKSDYYALLARSDRRGVYDAWFWDLRDIMPTIAVPLRPPFPDVPLDLQAAFTTAYSEARYDDQLSYEGMPPLPRLRSADAAWAVARITSWRAGRAVLRQPGA